MHSGFFQTLDQTTYTFKIIKMVAHSKDALLKACTSIMLSTIVKKRRARRAEKDELFGFENGFIKIGVNSGAFPRITKKSLKILQDSESFRIFLRMNKAWKHVDKSRTHPGEHDASSQRCFNVGPSS